MFLAKGQILVKTNAGRGKSCESKNKIYIMMKQIHTCATEVKL